MAYREVPIATQACHRCSAVSEAGIDLCPRCGAPMAVGEYAELALRLEPIQRSARRWMAVAACLCVVGFLVVLLVSAAFGLSPLLLLIQGLFTAFFVGAWALSRRFPLGAPLAVACVYGALELVELISVGLTGLGLGTVIKLLFFAALVRGAQAGYRIRDIERRAGRHDRLILTATIAAFVLVGIVLGLALRRY